MVCRLIDHWMVSKDIEMGTATRLGEPIRALVPPDAAPDIK